MIAMIAIDFLNW